MDPYDPYYSYQPLGSWLGILRYYGALVKNGGWESRATLFDFVKQLSTSSHSVEFQPTLIDDVLFLSREPLTAGASVPRRISIDMTEDQKIQVGVYEADSYEPRTASYTREAALPMLARILKSL